MKKRILFVQLFLVISSFCGLAEPLLAGDDDLLPILKTVEVDGRVVTLRGSMNVESKALEIRVQEDTSITGTNNVVISVPAQNIGPCGFDFAMSPEGKVLWVFLEEIRRLDRQHIFRIYLFIRNPERKDEYVPYTPKNDLRHAPIDACGAFSLSEMLRLLTMSSFNKGKPLALGPSVHIEGVRLQSTNASAVCVTGNLGKNYHFRGTVLLRENNDLVAKDFVIEPIIDVANTNSQETAGQK